MNDPEACDAIGLFFLFGDGRPRDRNQAAIFFFGGATLGDDDALLHLSQMYEAGDSFLDPSDHNAEVTAPDYEKALDAYTKSADLGNRIAAYQASLILNNSATDLRDKTSAVRYLEQAVRHQYPQARVVLGDLA